MPAPKRHHHAGGVKNGRLMRCRVKRYKINNTVSNCKQKMVWESDTTPGNCTPRITLWYNGGCSQQPG